MPIHVLHHGFFIRPVAARRTRELVIAGKGLARGYWNLPEETDKRFVPDPFYPGERMYRTGDLVKWTEDGELIYLGRIDHQVNIRGFRIELSEIEAQLLTLDSVKEAVVTTVKDAGDQDALAAYVITKNDTDTENLKRKPKTHVTRIHGAIMDHKTRSISNDGQWKSRSQSIAST